MLRVIIGLLLCCCLSGCMTGEEVRAGLKRDSQEKITTMMGKKITNVRLNATSIDLVLEDGTLVTIYGYGVTNGGDVHYSAVGVK